MNLQGEFQNKLPNLSLFSNFTSYYNNKFGSFFQHSPLKFLLQVGIRKYVPILEVGGPSCPFHTGGISDF